MLLVDDDPVILRSHARCLDGEFAVETCASALDADRRVAKGGIDVVVSDISMPEMSGLELLSAIRTRDAYLPVILASAAATLESRNQAIDDGAFVYLGKPVNPAMFRAAVRLAVQHRRTHRRGPSRRPSTAPREK